MMPNEFLTHRGASEDFTNIMMKTKMIFAHNSNDEILLNNFQIKKKRYKVLLNCNHIVWERLDAKRCQKRNDNENNEKKPPASTLSIPNETTTAAIEKGLYTYNRSIHIIHESYESVK